MARAISNKNVLAATFETADFDGPYLASFGRPELRGVWIIWGTSGSGKTTFTLQLCKYLSKFGKVAYDSLEHYQRRVLAFQRVHDIVHHVGSGKTEAIKNYTAGGRNVYHMVCSEYWNRRTFMAKLLQNMGATVAGATVSDMMDNIVDTLKRKDTPLIVLDEADKLSDQVLYFFISLYNQLEDQCGIILTATSYLRNRIERGVRLNRKGYAEIYSRIGRKFVELPALNGEDVAAVCVANGVSDSKTVNRIIDESDSDLRRVKRSVWAELKKGAQ